MCIRDSTYTIQIVAKGKGSTLLSSELGDLKVYQKISDSTGKLSNDAMGAFHCDTFRYNVGVAADATEVYLQAKPYQANLKYQDAVITVDGQTFDWQDAVAKSLSNSNQSLYNAGEYMIISLRSPITTVEVACKMCIRDRVYTVANR